MWAVDSRTPLSVVDDKLEAVMLPLKQMLGQTFAGYGDECPQLSIEKSFDSSRVFIPSCGCEKIFSINRRTETIHVGRSNAAVLQVIKYV
jgi:hypothetical protein